MNNECEPQYPCIESTVEFQTGSYEIRAWINEEAVQNSYDNSEFKRVAAMNAHVPLGELAARLASLPRVNAVHVKQKQTGDGIVLYINWP